MITNRIKCENYLIENNLEPITEQSNKITKNIDLSKTGKEIVQLLARTDLEILNGWQINGSLKTDGIKNDTKLLDKLNRLSFLLSDKLNNNELMVILTGCGTSGRLAYLYSQRLNEYFNRNVADYILAGGEYALVNSIEAVEDQPEVGIQELKAKLEIWKDKKIILIGITCGLSAPYVAGQLDLLMNLMPTNNDILGCALIGFNPIRMARQTSLMINKTNQTFLNIIQTMESLEIKYPNKYFILNPLIGPEPITGSSRMKSGSSTKILLDILFSNLICISENNLKFSNNEMLNYYDLLFNKIIYSDQMIESVGQLIDSGAECLKNNGSINYLCGLERLGLLACIDASECVPTYGAKITDIRGFIQSSNDKSVWSGIIENCPETDSNYIIQNLNTGFNSSNCFFLIIGNESIAIRKELLKTQSKIYYLDIFNSDMEFINENKIVINGLSNLLNDCCNRVNKFFADCIQEMALKLILNAISTGCHVLIGKVCQNLMIDVKVSNIKLYQRAISIIRQLNNYEFTNDEAEHYLLNSIYEDKEYIKKNIDEHIKIATKKESVVPIALSMALNQIDYQEAKKQTKDLKKPVRK